MKKIKVYLSALLFFIISSITASSQNILSLKGAIQEAIKKSMGIKIACEEEKVAFEKKQSSLKDLLPKLSLSYSFTHLKDEPYINFTPFHQRIVVGDRDKFMWNVELKQPIFTGFSLMTQKKISDLFFNIKKLEKEMVILDIVQKVRVNYFNVLLKKRYVEISKGELEQLKSHLKDAKLFYSQGLIPYNDVLKSQVALKEAEQKLTTAKSQYRVALASLNLTLERDINDNTIVEDIKEVKIKPYNFKKLINYAIIHRPEIKVLKLYLKTSDLKIVLNRSSFYPKVFLFARYQQEGENLVADKNSYQNYHNAAVGVNLTWNIFEFGKTLSEVRAAEHQKLAIQKKLEETKKIIKLEVKKAFESLIVAQKNIKVAKEALKQAKENFRITDLQYKQQLASSTDVIDAQMYLTKAKANYYNSIYGYMIAEASLKRAIGENPLMHFQNINNRGNENAKETK